MTNKTIMQATYQTNKQINQASQPTDRPTDQANNILIRQPTNKADRSNKQTHKLRSTTNQPITKQEVSASTPAHSQSWK